MQKEKKCSARSCPSTLRSRTPKSQVQRSCHQKPDHHALRRNVKGDQKVGARSQSQLRAERAQQVAKPWINHSGSGATVRAVKCNHAQARQPAFPDNRNRNGLGLNGRRTGIQTYLQLFGMSVVPQDAIHVKAILLQLS